MPILPPGLSKTFQLAPGETLSLVTDSASVCRYGLLIPPPPGSAVGEQPSGSPVSVPSGSAITVGPRGDVSRWLVDQVLGANVSVVQNPASAVPDFGAPPDVQHIYGSGAPSAATGANQAAPGSLYTDTSGAKLYVQGGTKAVPSWRIVTSA
jgi:hypothetical protein